VETRSALESTLLALQPALAQARQPWWIIGSGAVALHGGDPGEVRDLDLLLDRRDFAAVTQALGLVPSVGEGDGRFRSDHFNHWTGAALPVDLFAGFHLLEGGQWHHLLPATRIAARLGGAEAYVPERADLAVLLARFGRDKDQARIAALSATFPFPSRSGSA
jgi:hypothetical protein